MTAPLPPVGLRLMLRIRTPPHRSPQFTAAASHYRFASVRPSVVSFAFHNTVLPNKRGVDACRLLAVVLFLCASETQSLDGCGGVCGAGTRLVEAVARPPSTGPIDTAGGGGGVSVVGGSCARAHLRSRPSGCRDHSTANRRRSPPTTPYYRSAPRTKRARRLTGGSAAAAYHTPSECIWCFS